MQVNNPYKPNASPYSDSLSTQLCHPSHAGGKTHSHWCSLRNLFFVVIVCGVIFTFTAHQHHNYGDKSSYVVDKNIPNLRGNPLSSIKVDSTAKDDDLSHIKLLNKDRANSEKALRDSPSTLESNKKEENIFVIDGKFGLL